MCKLLYLWCRMLTICNGKGCMLTTYWFNQICCVLNLYCSSISLPSLPVWETSREGDVNSCNLRCVVIKRIRQKWWIHAVIMKLKCCDIYIPKFAALVSCDVRWSSRVNCFKRNSYSAQYDQIMKWILQLGLTFCAKNILGEKQTNVSSYS